MNTRDIVINSKATFLRYQNDVAYYTLSIPYSEMRYSFPVPLKLIQDNTLSAESHTIHLMDYIHNAIREGTLMKETA